MFLAVASWLGIGWVRFQARGRLWLACPVTTFGLLSLSHPVLFAAAVLFQGPEVTIAKGKARAVQKDNSKPEETQGPLRPTLGRHPMLRPRARATETLPCAHLASNTQQMRAGSLLHVHGAGTRGDAQLLASAALLILLVLSGLSEPLWLCPLQS